MIFLRHHLDNFNENKMGAGIKANGRRQSRGKVGINLLPARIRPTQNPDCWAWPDLAREGRPLRLAWVAKRQLFFLASFYGAENNWLVLFALHLMLWKSEHFMQKVQLCSK